MRKDADALRQGSSRRLYRYQLCMLRQLEVLSLCWIVCMMSGRSLHNSQCQFQWNQAGKESINNRARWINCLRRNKARHVVPVEERGGQCHEHSLAPSNITVTDMRLQFWPHNTYFTQQQPYLNMTHHAYENNGDYDDNSDKSKTCYSVMRIIHHP